MSADSITIVTGRAIPLRGMVSLFIGLAVVVTLL